MGFKMKYLLDLTVSRGGDQAMLFSVNKTYFIRD